MISADPTEALGDIEEQVARCGSRMMVTFMDWRIAELRIVGS